MKKKKSPKLRTVNHIKPPFPLNRFPSNFHIEFGKEVIFLLASKSKASLEGPEWERIFAHSIGGSWTPSNVGLDDITLGNCAWSAKSVKSNNPEKQSRIRLISGRNSPTYSYGENNILKIDPNELGEQVLSIWNERVSFVRAKHEHLRTVVLIKGKEFDTFGIFEFDTVRYDSELINWRWNKNNNLEGYDQYDFHLFTWQPHGSQFTIIENAPDDAIIIKIKKPPVLDKDAVLKNMGFNKSWISVKKKNDG
jgi:hypothetical protein